MVRAEKNLSSQPSFLVTQYSFWRNHYLSKSASDFAKWEMWWCSFRRSQWAAHWLIFKTSLSLAKQSGVSPKTKITFSLVVLAARILIKMVLENIWLVCFRDEWERTFLLVSLPDLPAPFSMTFWGWKDSILPITFALLDGLILLIAYGGAGWSVSYSPTLKRF